MNRTLLLPTLLFTLTACGSGDGSDTPAEPGNPVSGTTAKASEVNDNFNALETE